MTGTKDIPLTDAQNRMTVARITWIAEAVKARSYLEIGVNKGQTFANVGLPRKVAVDPEFKFDWKALQTPQVTLHQMPSDAFFASQPPEAFDVIFLDGLHTFEQCFRDFCATQALAHANTVWLIDDTVPNDAFSIERSVERTMQLRRAHGITNGSWHGDVFRTAFAIHDFFPTYDFRTVMGTGNPQTIVVKSGRPAFAPMWNDLGRIGTLGFGDFLDGREMLKPCSEAEAQGWLQDWAGRR